MKKGYKFEWEFMNRLKKHGFLVIRSGGSGRSETPDIIAVKNGKVFIFECKSSKEEKIYIGKKQVETLKKWKSEGATVYIAIKMKRKGVFLLPLEKIEKTNNAFVAEAKNGVPLQRFLNDF